MYQTPKADDGVRRDATLFPNGNHQKRNSQNEISKKKNP